MTYASHEQIPKKSAFADQAASSFKRDAQSELLSCDSLSSSEQKSLRSLVVKYCSSSSEAEPDGRNTRSLQNALPAGHGVRSEVLDEDPDGNVIWVVKPPVRLRHIRTPAARARNYGDIQVNFRLLAAKGRQKTKREPVKPPVVLPESRSHFKVYQVQRRGEQSAKLVAGRTIHQTSKPIEQQPTNHGPGRLGTAQSMQEGHIQFHSERLSQPSSSHAWLPTGNVSKFQSDLSPPKKLSCNVAVTANKQVESPNEGYNIGRDGLPKEQRVVPEKAAGEERPKESCGSVSTLVSSLLASFNALCPVSISLPSASVDRTQPQGHSPEQQQPAVSWEEHSKSAYWTTQASPQSTRAETPYCERSVAHHEYRNFTVSQGGQPFSSFDPPQSLEPTTTPIPEDRSSSCGPAMPCDSVGVPKVQTLSYGCTLRSNAISPVIQRPPSSVPAAVVGGDANTQASSMTEIPRSCSAGCMNVLKEACGGWCGPESTEGGIASDVHVRPQLTVECYQKWTGETPTAPQQHNLKREFVTPEQVSSTGLAGGSVKPSAVAEGASECRSEAPQPTIQHQDFLQRMFTFEKTPETQFVDDKVRSSAGKGGALEDVDTRVEQVTRTGKLTDQCSHTLKTPAERKEYAVFLPQNVRSEELGTQDKVPVIFRILHRRRARLGPRPKAEPLPPPRVAPSPPTFKQVFHFRVLQQRHPRDDENRRLVAFKAPTHYRPNRVSSSLPQQHFGAPSSLDCSYSCASPCSETAERLTSTSSTSSLVTLRYVHKRTYVPLPRLPVREIQMESHGLLSKATVSRSAARIAQEATRRVNRRRPEWRAKAKAREPPKKEAEQDQEEKSPKKPRRFENAQTCTDSLWCCAVRDEREEPQLCSADGDEIMACSHSTQSRDVEIGRKGSSSGAPRDTDPACETSGEKVELVEVQSRAAEETASALRKDSLCKKVGDWFRCGHLGLKGAGTNEELRRGLPSLQSEVAIEDIRSSRQEKDKPLVQAATPSKSVFFSIVSCCRPTPREEPSPLKESSFPYITSDEHADKTDSGLPIPLPTYTEPAEGGHWPQPGMDYPQAAPKYAAPPLYSLPVVSFLPPVFEPLPVVETVSVCSQVQLPVCCFAIPPAPMEMCTGQDVVEQRNFSLGNGSGDTSPVSQGSTNRVRICVLPAREPVTYL